MIMRRERRAVRRDSNSTAIDPNLPQKTDQGLVVLDNPDDGELFETGDASDFAGERDERGEPHNPGARKALKAKSSKAKSPQ